MSASLPSRFLDASDVRPVPDHQEVWHDGGGGGDTTAAGLQAVLVEIAEHDGEGVADAAAGAHFFDDAAEGAGAAAGPNSTYSREVDPSQLPAPRMPPPARPTAAREGAFVVAAAAPAGGAPSRMQLLAAAVAVFRLPRVASDVVITSFEPAGPWPPPTEATAATTTAPPIEAAAAAAVAAARRRLARVVASVKVHDWGLFGGGEEEEAVAAAAAAAAAGS